MYLMCSWELEEREDTVSARSVAGEDRPTTILVYTVIGKEVFNIPCWEHCL